MRKARDSENSGSIQTLLDKGFAERAAENPTIFSEITQDYEKIKIGKPTQKVVHYPTSFLREKETVRGARLPIKIRGKTRLFKPSNITYINYNWRGKPAFYVYNNKTKRRLTWGIY